MEKEINNLSTILSTSGELFMVVIQKQDVTRNWAKKKREVHQFDLMASRLHIVPTVVKTICQMYFGGLSILTVSGESV